MLNARTGLGPAVKLYNDDTLLATFADVVIFAAIMDTPSVVAFNQEKRSTIAQMRAPQRDPMAAGGAFPLDGEVA